MLTAEVWRAATGRSSVFPLLSGSCQTECDLLGLDDFDRLGALYSNIKIELLENLSLILARRLGKATLFRSLLEAGRHRFTRE